MTGLQNDNCHLNEQIFLSSSGGNFGRSQCGESGEVEYKLQDQQEWRATSPSCSLGSASS